MASAPYLSTRHMGYGVSREGRGIRRGSSSVSWTSSCHRRRGQDLHHGRGREGRTVDNEVLEGGLVKEGGGEDHQGVEPATGLIETLSDEIGGEALL